MRDMVFLFVFLIGLILPFILMKVKTKWGKWIPAMIFLVGTIIMAVKSTFFPAGEMAVLGEIVYAMLLATMTGGACIGAVIIHFWIRKK
jgi:hypothetical protein